MDKTKWITRTFPVITDNGLLPGIMERLEGTPARIETKVRGLSADRLEFKPADKWSIKEEIGHLGDLEPLWLGRIDDFEAGLGELRPADMSNKKTYEADHQKKDIMELVGYFTSQRNELVRRMRDLNGDILSRISMHPRLKTPMRVVDLAYFVAEHDDHHLANISAIIHGT